MFELRGPDTGVPSSDRRARGFFQDVKGLLVRATRGCGHRLAILVNQRSDPTRPYQALMTRESAMLFPRV